MGRRPHVLIIAYPAQGHIGPLMKLSQLLADQGIRVTFVNAESIHDRVVAALPEEDGGGSENPIEIVSITDGLEPDDHKDSSKIKESMSRFVPKELENLIRKINSSASEDEKIKCVIADATVPWALETAENLGIKKAMFWPSAVRGFVLTLQVPKLIEDGIIDHCGNFLKNEMVQISPNLSAINTSDFIWNCPGNQIRQETLFEYVLTVTKTIKISNFFLCNSFIELDPLACDYIPNLLPIGPLLSTRCSVKKASNLWNEDQTCLDWLEKQPERSLIYVAFGSKAMFKHDQFEELALGLGLVGQPFLWVVRSDLITNGSVVKYPDGYCERVMNRAKMVNWAPQEMVLAHPSIACFLTHCGWNSCMEGISFGVPFLCWPYFGDQFHIRSYVCDVLMVGLGLEIDENIGIVSRFEIKEKLEKLLLNVGIKENALKLKEMAEKSVSEGGSSLKNLKSFVEELRS